MDSGGCGEALPTLFFSERGNRLDLIAPREGNDSPGRSLDSGGMRRAPGVRVHSL